ncbi:hypothetical protein TREES_T100012814, partial [Tupaia chinensis]
RYHSGYLADDEAGHSAYVTRSLCPTDPQQPQKGLGEPGTQSSPVELAQGLGGAQVGDAVSGSTGLRASGVLSSLKVSEAVPNPGLPDSKMQLITPTHYPPAPGGTTYEVPCWASLLTVAGLSA